MSITLDTRAFEAALKQALLHTKRDMPAVLNGHAIGVISKAAKLTPKADKASIPYKLYSETSYKKKSAALIYLMLNARARKAGGKGLNNDAMRAAAKKLINARVASIGFTAYAGWDNALRAVGGKGFGSKGHRKGFEKSSAAAGSGRKATSSNMTAIGINTAAWAEHIGAKPLQEALDAEAAEIYRHLEEKLSKHCKEASK